MRARLLLPLLLGGGHRFEPRQPRGRGRGRDVVVPRRCLRLHRGHRRGLNLYQLRLRWLEEEDATAGGLRLLPRLRRPHALLAVLAFELGEAHHETGEGGPAAGVLVPAGLHVFAQLARHSVRLGKAVPYARDKSARAKIILSLKNVQNSIHIGLSQPSILQQQNNRRIRVLTRYYLSPLKKISEHERAKDGRLQLNAKSHLMP